MRRFYRPAGPNFVNRLIPAIPMLAALAAFLLAGPLAAAQSDSNWADLRQRAADLVKRARVPEATRLLTDGIAAARGQDDTSAGFAEALSDLGALHHESARLSEAESVYKKSLSVWGRITGIQPNSAVTLGNFAALRLAQGRPSDALKLYRRAEHVLASSYGASSPQAAWVSCGLADVYWAMGRYEDAKQTIERVSADLELHGHQMELAVALFLRAKIAWRESQLPEAERLIRRAIDLWEKSLGSQHPTYASGLASLAVLVSGKDPNEADRLFRKSLEVLEARFGPDHAYAGFTLVLYARHLKDLGRKSDANSLKRRGEEILAKYSHDNLLGHTLDVKAFARLQAR